MNVEKSIFHEYLKSHGHKKTVQRDVILEVFLKTEKHITPQELHHIIIQDHPDIGLSTVYRTLKILAECNLAEEIHRKDGSSVFERKHERPHHDHLICNKCGKYIEFINQTIEEIQKQVAREHGFKMKGHKLEIYGICKECQQEEKREMGEGK